MKREMTFASKFLVLLAASTLAAALPAALSAAPRTENETNLADSDIRNAIDTELMFDDGVSAERIDATVRDGIATLSGSVDNVLAQDRAVDIARSTKGVRSVIDQISVKPVARTDLQIHNDIVTTLASDPTVESFEVSPEVDDGVVTLSGEVDSWAEKQLAVVRTKGVRGVRDVVDAIEVQADFSRPDAEVRHDIEGRLANDVRIDSGLIDVEVDAGAVILTGVVGSAAEKQAAETLAWTVGAKSVDAQGLEVQWWARDEMKRKALFSDRTDAEIEDAVEDAWLYDPRVDSFNLHASSNNGKVILTGEVDNFAAKWSAADDARHTQGVWKVTNLVRVRTTEFRSDEEIAEDIRSALLRDPYVERFELNTEVINGRAYLDGEVGTHFERNQAETLAGMVKGVLNVVNNIDVRPSPPNFYLSDRALKDQVEDELFWSPFVDSDQVSVDVDDGVVTLNGRVDSWSEFRSATENAYEGGATYVDNDLVVSFGES